MGGAPPLPLDFTPQGGKKGLFFALFLTPRGSRRRGSGGTPDRLFPPRPTRSAGPGGRREGGARGPPDRRDRGSKGSAEALPPGTMTLLRPSRGTGRERHPWTDRDPVAPRAQSGIYDGEPRRDQRVTRRAQRTIRVSADTNHCAR